MEKILKPTEYLEKIISDAELELEQGKASGPFVSVTELKVDLQS